MRIEACSGSVKDIVWRAAPDYKWTTVHDNTFFILWVYVEMWCPCPLKASSLKAISNYCNYRNAMGLDPFLENKNFHTSADSVDKARRAALLLNASLHIAFTAFLLKIFVHVVMCPIALNVLNHCYCIYRHLAIMAQRGLKTASFYLFRTHVHCFTSGTFCQYRKQIGYIF